MITVNLYYTGIDGNARQFVEEMERSGTADLIRAEKGNVRYEYFFPMNDPETVLLIDAWESQEAIDVHHASPMMKTIAELREKGYQNLYRLCFQGTAQGSCVQNREIESEHTYDLVTKIVTNIVYYSFWVKKILTCVAFCCIIQTRKRDPYQRRRQEQWLI